MIGQIFGQFRIVERLGAGGMGEVYKAEDARLHRAVALKFLPPELAGSKPARERFEREARAIAGLNHPNICTLYEFGEQNGQAYLVMELLEGATLRERVQRQLPSLAQLLEWAIQMADALDYAHRRGIIHRDLKPANIYITQHQQAKILDFGLARLGGPDDPADLIGAETQSLPAPQLTSPGSTLGTVAYMSPEQARGETVDARSDIFSLGVVLYEAATGKSCFQAKSTAETFSQILNHHPPRPSQAREELPPELDRIILRALQKDAELRYQHASDLRAELKLLQRERLGAGSARDAAAASSTASIPQPASSAALARETGSIMPSAASSAGSDSQIVSALLGRHRKGLLGTGIFLVLLAGGLGGWYWHTQRAKNQLRALLRRWRNARVINLTSSGLVVAPVAISPDGNYVAYVHRGPRGESLWLRQVHAASGEQIVPPPVHPPANYRYEGLSFTPDGSFLDYVAGNEIHPDLYQVPILGGQPVKLLANVETPPGFSPHGRRMAFVRCDAAHSNDATLMLARGDGTHPRPLTTIADLGLKNELFYCSNFSYWGYDSPAWSPDGRRIAVGIEDIAPLRSQIAVIRVADGRSRILPWSTRIIAGLQWTPQGHELLGLAGNSFLNSFSHLTLISYPAGQAHQLSNGLTSYNSLSLDRAGRLLATQKQQAFYSLWEQMPQQPAKQLLPAAANQLGSFAMAWTPQGAIAYQAMTGDRRWAIYTLDPAQPNASPRQFGTARALAGISVGPQGQMVYVQIRHGSQLRAMATDLRHSYSRVLSRQAINFISITPSGRNVIFIERSKNSQVLEEMPLQGGTPRIIAPYFAGSYFRPAVSPRGRRILLETHAPDGKMTAVIFPRAHPRAGQFLPARRQMQWRPDGRGISYVKTTRGADNIWIEPAPGQPGQPRPYTHFQHQRIISYAWSAGGNLALARAHRYGSVVLLQARGRGKP